MSLKERQLALGAALAPDGIPLHFGDLRAEYHAALETAVLMDRSHEGRLSARGRDRLNLIQRISTNDVCTNILPNEGRPTIFTNANGRILDRIVVYNRGETALLSTEPGRGASVLGFLQRQVFFNDEAAFADLAANTHQFVLHGPSADQVIEALTGELSNSLSLYGIESQIGGASIYLFRRKPVSGSHWAMIVSKQEAERVWNAFLEMGRPQGLVPAGSLTYNALRIRAGRPGVAHELTSDYIPLEAGLWDEVSFTKGCYTGQEIITRMESRNRLAKTMVTLRLTQQVEVPASLYLDGKQVGTLTSSVTTPDEETLGIGFVRLSLAVPGAVFKMDDETAQAEILSLTGAQSPHLVDR